jgi:type I restriction enzyme S subunit
LFYLFSSPLGRALVIAISSRTAVSGIRGSDLAQIKIPIPPLPTQRKIATILSAYDDLIENNTRRIKFLEEIAQALYREWFVHFRFPGHEGVKMVETEMGLVPEGWEVGRLSSLVETQYGYTESAREEEVGPKFLRGMDINKNSYIQWDQVPYCPIKISEYTKYKLSKGDVVVIRMADPGKVGIVEKNVDAVFASYLIRLRITSKSILPYFLYYYLLSDHYQSYILGASTGTTRKSASAGVMTDTSIILPVMEIQILFEDYVSPMRTMITNLVDKNANLRQTRDLLLPRLISGELDVSEVEVGGTVHE